MELDSRILTFSVRVDSERPIRGELASRIGNLGVEVADVAGNLEEVSSRVSQQAAQLFDERYREIPGTDPKQYLTDYVAFTDRILPPIQDPIQTYRRDMGGGNFVLMKDLSRPSWSTGGAKSAFRMGFASCERPHHPLSQTLCLSPYRPLWPIDQSGYAWHRLQRRSSGAP